MSEQDTPNKEEITQDENTEGNENPSIEGSRNDEGQEKIDKIVKERLARQAKKYEKFDEYKAKAEKYDKIQEENMSELEKANERAEKAEAKLATLEKAEEKRGWATKASKETGVDISLIRGDSYEDMLEHAQAISKHIKSYPEIKDDGKPAGNNANDKNAQDARLREAAGLKPKD